MCTSIPSIYFNKTNRKPGRVLYHMVWYTYDIMRPIYKTMKINKNINDTIVYENFINKIF